MDSSQIRDKYLRFFQSRGHQIIPSAPLVPENDPTTLFTGSGMQPMMPYLLGESHPLGNRIVDSQKCFRAQDIEEVGDNRHTTFFEMLGNWSLGDYFKKEQLAWIYEFLTKELELPAAKLFVSVFEGNDEIPRDSETANIWEKLGLPSDHISYYPVKKNWWNRGEPYVMPIGEPGGPDSEVFYDFGTPHDPKFGDQCHPNCDCGRFLEIGNSVFMTYKKTGNGFVPLAKKNIDFGGGLERITAAVKNEPDIFQTDLFNRIVEEIEINTGKKYDKENQPPIRIIADHIKAATFLISENLSPANKGQGYVLRRLLRRSAVKMHFLSGGLRPNFSTIIDRGVLSTYEGVYFDRDKVRNQLFRVVEAEMDKFSQSLDRGLKLVGKISPFDLLQTYGFPVEITEELLSQKGLKFDSAQFNQQLQKHQDLSRTSSAGMFKGGLEDHSEITTRYHTATHLLHKALRDVLGDHVHQAGSNITSERLRFDFTHPTKLTPEEIKKVEDAVNQKIVEDMQVTREEIPKQKALSQGALAFFPEKYPEITSVFTIGPLDNWYSKELCGGPHVTSTGAIGRIKIIKEESAGSNTRRIYAKIA